MLCCPFSISAQGFQSVAWWRSKTSKFASSIKLIKLSPRHCFDVRSASDSPALMQSRRVTVGK
jgi:hypothetical protein